MESNRLLQEFQIPAFIRAETPPHITACSPKRSVSVSSLKVVSIIPARPAPIAEA